MRPAPDDPSNFSPHERLRELTAILANGIHRLRGVTAALDTADAAQRHGSHGDPRASLAPPRQGPAVPKFGQIPAEFSPTGLDPGARTCPHGVVATPRENGVR